MGAFLAYGHGFDKRRAGLHTARQGFNYTVIGVEMNMSKSFLLALVILSGSSLGASANNWTCSAQNMQSFKYDGGATAYIHLAPYSYGGDYPVAMNKAKTQATGKTANGTTFTCVKRK